MLEGKQVAADLKQSTGIDFSQSEGVIQDYFDNWLYQGNYYGTLDEEGMPRSLFFAQEDAHDNDEDEDERPDESNYVCYSSGHYIFFA